MGPPRSGATDVPCPVSVEGLRCTVKPVSFTDGWVSHGLPDVPGTSRLSCVGTYTAPHSIFTVSSSEYGWPCDLPCGLLPASATDEELAEDRALWSEVQGLSGGPWGSQHHG